MHTDHTRRVYRHTTPLSDVLFQGTTHTMCVPAQNSTVRCTFPRSSTHSHTLQKCHHTGFITMALLVLTHLSTVSTTTKRNRTENTTTQTGKTCCSSPIHQPQTDSTHASSNTCLTQLTDDN